MTDNSAPAPGQRAPSLAQVNLLLLVSVVLVLGVAMFTSGLHFYWTLLIREVFLILGPALLFLLLLRLPWRETLRWRLPRLRVLAVCALVGIGGWLFDIWLGALTGELLGYTLPLPPDFYPTELGQALALFGLLAVVAPICEEVLFRGLIQRGYEQLGTWAGIVLTGLLFALFHQSLLQGLALLPLAILLSYLAWRTNSLPAAMLAHAANNAPAAVLVVMSTLLSQMNVTPDATNSADLAANLTADLASISPAICALPAALLGGVLVLGGLWGLRRWCPAPTVGARAPLKPGLGPWLGRTWPLLIVVPLALGVIGTEVVMGRFPELLSMGRPIRWAAAPWEGTRTWSYEVRNVLDETVGTVECQLEPQETAYSLTCQRRQSAYEADTGFGVYYGGDVDERVTARWGRPDLDLLSVDRDREQETGWRSFSAVLQGNTVTATLGPQEGPPYALSLPLLGPGRTRPPTVIEGSEWPWRFSALPLQGVYSAQAALLDPDPVEGGGPTLTRTTVLVYGSELVSTPAGTLVAWRVEVGPDHVAWYDAESPHTLVRLENGIETWVLVSSE